MRFDYLNPAQGEVIKGLEHAERIIALEQPQYKPLRTLQGEHGHSLIYRVELTFDQRLMIEDGADILIEILTFGGPLAPSRVMLLNQNNLEPDIAPKEHRLFLTWLKAQLGLIAEVK